MNLFSPFAAVRELTARQQLWEKWGLTLSPKQIELLAEHQTAVLQSTCRVEFGGGILPKLADAFCDSPCIQSDCWADILAELTELFYTLKNETGDQIEDDVLILAMVARFNDDAGGSVDALASTEPAWFLRYSAERGTYDGL